MLKIENYIQQPSMWPMIKKYIFDYVATYKLPSDSDDQTVISLITNLARDTFADPNERNTFKKTILNLSQGKTNTLIRKNQHRLCYVLGLSSQQQADLFLCDYLHTNELSARSLQEFIIVCGLNCGLSWEKTKAIQQDFREAIDAQPLAPKTINLEDQTYNLVLDVINQTIKTEQDLRNYLSSEQNLAFFARTRNQHYKSLFSDIIYYKENGRIFLVNDENRDSNLLARKARSTKLYMQHYYNRLFYMYANNPEEMDNHLTEEEVNSLIPIFPETFMTIENFRDLVQRKRPIDISAGTFLLHYLLTAPVDNTPATEGYAYEEYVDFSNPEEFIEACNDALFDGGFPSLNRNNNFDALVLDVYHETICNNNNASSLTIKLDFLYRLRKYLKAIASYNG